MIYDELLCNIYLMLYSYVKNICENTNAQIRYDYNPVEKRYGNSPSSFDRVSVSPIWEGLFPWSNDLLHTNRCGIRYPKNQHEVVTKLNPAEDVTVFGSRVSIYI
jgi:hypothetical protein